MADRFSDQLELSGHAQRLKDIKRLADLGISTIRYPILWERTAPDAPDLLDWKWADERMSCFQELRLKPIVGLVHSAPWRIEVEVLEEGKRIAIGDDQTAVATGRLALTIPYAKLWSPEHPHLYDLRIRLFDGEELLDEVGSYVGLRGIELRDSKLLLNGIPNYLKMILDQGYWRQGHLTAPTDEALQLISAG